MVFKKMMPVLFGILALSVTGVSAVERASADGNCQEFWIQETAGSAQYPRLTESKSYLTAYVNEAIDFSKTEYFELSFSLSESSLYTDSNARKWFISLTNDGGSATNMLPKDVFEMVVPSGTYKGISFAFSAESGWGGCMAGKVFDGYGQSNTGTYLGNGEGWPGDFGADTTKGAKTEGTVPDRYNFSLSLWNQETTLRISADADYYNFKFYRGTDFSYTYSILRTRVESGSDFTSNPRLCLGCVNFGAAATNMGYNIGATVTRQLKGIVAPLKVDMAPGDVVAYVPTCSDPSDSIASIVPNDTSVVTYSNGQLTAVGSGSTTVTVTSTLGKVATTTVNVSKPKNKIAWPKQDVSIVKKQEKAMAATVTIVPGSESSSTAVTYSSSNTSVVTYENGKLVGKGVGQAVVTAESADHATADLVVNVLDYEYNAESTFPYVASLSGNPEIVPLEDGVFFNSTPSNTVADMIDAPKFYIDAPVNIGKYVAFDMQMQFGDRWVSAGGSSTKYCRLDIAMNDLGPEGEEDLTKLQIPTSSGIDGAQLKLYSDAGWSAWNNFQYNTYINGTAGFGTDQHSANLSDANVNAVVKEMRDDHKVNVYIERTNTGLQMKISAYETDGSVSETKKWVITFTGEIGYTNKPYVGFVIENTTDTPVDLGLIVSNYRNGSVKQIVIKDGTTPISSLVLNPNDNKQITMETILNKGAESFVDTYTYEMSDSSIATCSDSGLIHAVKPGNTKLTVTDKEGEKAYLDVAVDVNSLSVDGTRTRAATYGDAPVQLTAVVDPQDVTVIWSSSNENIATVDATGKVTFTGAGSVVITAKAGAHSVDTTFNVEGGSITLTKHELTLNTTDSFVLRTNRPDAKGLVWTSSNEDVAIVASDGTVTGIDEGTATITVQFGDKTDTCVVTVENGYGPTPPGPTSSSTPTTSSQITSSTVSSQGGSSTTTSGSSAGSSSVQPEPKKGGCGGSIAASGIIILSTLVVAGAMIAKKKKEDK